jgi:hypothetical protein
MGVAALFVPRADSGHEGGEPARDERVPGALVLSDHDVREVDAIVGTAGGAVGERLRVRRS